MRCPTLGELPLPPLGKTGWPWTGERSQPRGDMLDGALWPCISIVTPSYNQGEFLEETIRSVLSQEYPNLEYIILDGGSTDESADIIRKYEPWLSHVRIGPDDGQAAAIAEGFRHATGDILAWLNSDDRYRPGALQRVGRFFTIHKDVVFANGDVNYVDVDGAFLLRSYAVRPNSFLAANIAVHGWPQPGSFWRREAYEQVEGIDPSLQFSMDRDLFIRLVGAGKSRTIPGPPLADFRTHGKAKSSTLRTVQAREDQTVIARYADPRYRSLKWLLRFLWWLWCKPKGLQARLDKILTHETRWNRLLAS